VKATSAANQLVQTVNHLDRKGIIYTYDELAQLVSATGGIEPEYKCPDAVGNLYETLERTDRKYESGGKLTKDKNWHYYYDTLGNLGNVSNVLFYKKLKHNLFIHNEV
jgi:hypothetical protein